MDDPTAAPAAAPLSAGERAAPGSLDDIVERWWNDHFPGSPVAQLTAAWNHAFAAKDELKRRLKEVL